MYYLLILLEGELSFYHSKVTVVTSFMIKMGKVKTRGPQALLVSDSLA